MRSILVLSLLVVVNACTKGPAAPTTPTVSPQEAKKAIAAVLDDFHRAASEPDEERYFGHFADTGGVFLGTDPAERWTVAEFREYAHERFAKGTGWTYVPSQRHVDLTADGNAAWFDEVVTNEKYGACRGTGALVRAGDAWKIAQYSLSLPIPNDMFRDVAEKVKAFE